MTKPKFTPPAQEQMAISEITINDYVQIWFQKRGKASFRLAKVLGTKGDRAIVNVIGKVKGGMVEISLKKDVFCVYKALPAGYAELPTEEAESVEA